MDTRGMSRRIKDALVTIAQGIQYNGEPAFVSVLDNSQDEFEGYPSLVILPNQIGVSDVDNVDRDHTVSYTAIMHWPLSGPAVVPQDVFNQMYDLTDLVLYALEHGDYSGELSQIDDQIQSWMLNTTQARWYNGQSKSGALLLCAFNIEVSFSQFVG